MVFVQYLRRGYPGCCCVHCQQGLSAGREGKSRASKTKFCTVCVVFGRNCVCVLWYRDGFERKRQGQSNGEIGKELFLSEDTIKTHARRLFRKLGARDRAQAVAVGFRRGLVA